MTAPPADGVDCSEAAVERMAEAFDLLAAAHTGLGGEAPASALLRQLRARVTELEANDAYMRQWIEAAPHGDNCFVSNHYEGDPGNRCNCGKDSLLDHLARSAP